MLPIKQTSNAKDIKKLFLKYFKNLGTKFTFKISNKYLWTFTKYWWNRHDISWLVGTVSVRFHMVHKEGIKEYVTSYDCHHV